MKFLASLKADVRLGPTGPRGRTGAIQADVLRSGNCCSMRQPTPSTQPHPRRPVLAMPLFLKYPSLPKHPSSERTQ